MLCRIYLKLTFSLSNMFHYDGTSKLFLNCSTSEMFQLQEGKHFIGYSNKDEGRLGHKLVLPFKNKATIVSENPKPPNLEDI